MWLIELILLDAFFGNCVCRLPPGTYTATVHVSLLNSTGAVFATKTGDVTFERHALPPTIELTRKGALWLVPANMSLVVNGKIARRTLDKAIDAYSLMPWYLFFEFFQRRCHKTRTQRRTASRA